MKKRSLALFLALVMALALCPTAALAAGAKAGDTTLRFTDSAGMTFIVELSSPIIRVISDGSDGEPPIYEVPMGTRLAKAPTAIAPYDQYGHAFSILTTGTSVTTTDGVRHKGLTTYYLKHTRTLPGNDEGETITTTIKLRFADTSTQPQTYTAMPTNDALTVNGAAVSPSAYKVNDENYFKLRDIACLLNGTSKQFNVGYDASTQSATITTGQGYAKQPTDLQGKPSASAEANVSSDPLVVNGVRRSGLTVYKINGSNYFRLRDLGDILGFSVDWKAGQGVIVNTGDAAGSQTDNSSLTAEVVRLVNIERAKEGLRPLGTFDTLDQAAAIRAEEIVTLFSHSRPDGSSCYTALSQTGADRGAHHSGENIAAGNATAAATVEQWMNSPGHRANILNPDFTHIGVGYASSPGGYHHYWVQMFVGK